MFNFKNSEKAVKTQKQVIVSFDDCDKIFDV